MHAPSADGFPPAGRKPLLMGAPFVDSFSYSLTVPYSPSVVYPAVRGLRSIWWTSKPYRQRIF